MDKLRPAKIWFDSLGWKPQEFQLQCWNAYLEGKSGLLNAPTGSGKTYGLLIPVLLEELALKKKQKGLKLIWISPIRALTKEIQLAANRAIQGLGLDWTCGVRTGDTSSREKAEQRKNMPDILITTPESLHLLLTRKDASLIFKNLRALVVDEWHELLGSKRGVQVELASSRIKHLSDQLRIWGISATIGNLIEAKQVLLGNWFQKAEYPTIRANIHKETEIISLLPDEIETFPWAGHLGIRMLDKVIPLIENSRSTLLFTNTRSFAEIWYQKILDAAPHMAGLIALHHGSISQELRQWVEEQLHLGALKAVVCTSSLDLGVDFRPVETIVQVGSPKGVSRFLQRAGRSGHRPGELSRIYFVPTHSLELLEGVALRKAAQQNKIEDRIPYYRSFDVLIQYLVTLAVGEGFRADETFREIQSTFCFQDIRREEFNWCLDFIVHGGQSLQAYNEFYRVENQDGLYKVTSRRIAMQQRLSIGTIVSDQMLSVKYMNGKRVGSIEEWFVSRLKPGDVFWLAGKNLEVVQFHYMDVVVKPATSGKKGLVPSWMGGRMPLSSNLATLLRQEIHKIQNKNPEPELEKLRPLFAKQEEISSLPHAGCFLIEKYQSREGFHVFAYPFEGRFVNEGIAALLAYRLSLIQPFTFSIAINDYGFELLSDQHIPIEMALDSDMFTSDHLEEDLIKSLNATEMARRKFRDIARISGLVFQGYPGQQVRQKHLQSISQLFFDVFMQYEPENLLLRQSFDEVMDFELDQVRLRKALKRIGKLPVELRELEKPSPFAFPILVDRLSREKYSNESMEDRVKKLLRQMNELSDASH